MEDNSIKIRVFWKNFNISGNSTIGRFMVSLDCVLKIKQLAKKNLNNTWLFFEFKIFIKNKLLNSSQQVTKFIHF